jgi:hypothetical protein
MSNEDHQPSTSCESPKSKDDGGRGQVGVVQDVEKEQARLLKHAKKCGFARIKGIGGLTHVDHVMRSYRIVLGRPNKSFEVDVSLGDTMNVSRRHGEIYYDFEKQGFFLRVLGKNGIQVDGTLVSPSDPDGGVVALASKMSLHVTSREEDRVVFLLPKRRRQFKRKSDGGEEGDAGEELADEEEGDGKGHDEDERGKQGARTPEKDQTIKNRKSKKTKE